MVVDKPFVYNNAWSYRLHKMLVKFKGLSARVPVVFQVETEVRLLMEEGLLSGDVSFDLSKRDGVDWHGAPGLPHYFG